MKVLSWNVRGMGNPQRRMVIIEVLSFNKVQIAMIQESKLSSMSDKIQRETWGGRFCKCVCVDAVDSAGGIILLWDYCTNTVLDIYYGKFSVSAWVEDSSNNSRWFVTSVYGPHSSQRPMDLWKELDAIKGRWNGTWCVGSNWNVVRFPSEKLGGVGPPQICKHSQTGLTQIPSLTFISEEQPSLGQVIKAFLLCQSLIDFW